MCGVELLAVKLVDFLSLSYNVLQLVLVCAWPHSCFVALLGGLRWRLLELRRLLKILIFEGFRVSEHQRGLFVLPT